MDRPDQNGNGHSYHGVTPIWWS